MPKRKEKKEESSSDSDSGPEDRGPAKKTKPVADKKASKSSEDNSWEIGKNRYAKLTEFKGKWYVDIREFYLAETGDLRPGKKGIMLTMEQWQKFKGHVDDIDEAIKEKV